MGIAMIKLDLGCGFEKHDGYVGVDIANLKDLYGNEFIQADLEVGKLPFYTESVTEIRCDHTLEHIRNLLPLMDECWRVLKDYGNMHIEVPSVNDIRMAFGDPTHVRYFAKNTFEFFGSDNRAKLYGFKRWNIVSILEHDGKINCTLQKLISL
jgi:ubiquinone/menaquinone biosynthesis C-methylase UbiE